MNQLQVFRYESASVRVMERGGESWWVAADVCDVLDIANLRDAASRLDEDERDDVGIADAIGREQPTTIINESGLHALILTSRKPEAKQFRKWITSEVLPALRKTGTYSVHPAEDPLVTQARLHLETVQRQVQLERAQREQQRQIDALSAQVSLTSTHMTLMGWCSTHGISLSRAESAREGKFLAKMCREKGLDVQKVVDVRFGAVNAYPAEVLTEWLELFRQSVV